MQFSIIITALLGAVATAFPAPADEVRRNDFEPIGAPDPNAGAFLYKQRNLNGTSVPAEKIAVAGNSFCTNIDGLYGDWNCKVRSLIVNPGFRCTFYVDRDCPQTCRKFWIGKEDDYAVKNRLIKDFDRKIKSVYCKSLEE